MNEKKFLTDEFESNRNHLYRVAFRMLGSAGEAEDAVQESWLRLNRADADAIDNLGGWLTTVVARVCLDMLRARKARREDGLEPDAAASAVDEGAGANPEREAMMADSVGLALLVVLDRLSPAERLAFVLHDMFAMPFEEIAPIVERSPEAARQLASRARRRVSGGDAADIADRTRRREVVDAFLAASRGGDFEALLTVLDPDVVFRADVLAVTMGSLAEIRGATAVANTFNGRAQGALPALVDGAPGLAVPIGGQIRVVLRLTISEDRIVAIEAIADPASLAVLDLQILGDASA